MSQENVEIVRHIDDAFQEGLKHGDFTAGFATGLVSEASEWVAPAEYVEKRSYPGREGFVEFMQTWTEAFDQLSLQRQELIDGGNDRVFGYFTQSAIGKGSGVPIELEFFLVYELEAGLLVRTRSYLSRDEALDAAGLRE
jgi:ketosteroid isomerase-like protein